MTTTTRRISQADWIAEGEALFPGMKSGDWRFVCPVCGHSQSARDFKDLGVPEAEINKIVGYSCIGRRTGARTSFDGKTRPCNYAGGGLFKLNPVRVFDEKGNEEDYFEWDRSGKAP
jgi:hypothetical protein